MKPKTPAPFCRPGSLAGELAADPVLIAIESIRNGLVELLPDLRPGACFKKKESRAIPVPEKVIEDAEIDRVGGNLVQASGDYRIQIDEQYAPANAVGLRS